MNFRQVFISLFVYPEDKIPNILMFLQLLILCNCNENYDKKLETVFQIKKSEIEFCI